MLSTYANASRLPHEGTGVAVISAEFVAKASFLDLACFSNYPVSHGAKQRIFRNGGGR
jgi:hypothetical protein